MDGWPWWLALVVLLLVYFYAHYAFASITAHATAMYIPFLLVTLAAGAPPMLAVLSLAYPLESVRLPHALRHDQHADLLRCRLSQPALVDRPHRLRPQPPYLGRSALCGGRCWDGY